MKSNEGKKNVNKNDKQKLKIQKKHKVVMLAILENFAKSDMIVWKKKSLKLNKQAIDRILWNLTKATKKKLKILKLK